MNTAPPAQNGFLVALSSAVGGVRGWPDADEAGSGSAVWFQGYLADSAGLCTVLGLDSRASLGRIVATGWQRWGVEVIERVVGEYAAVVVAGSDAVMVGDRMGLRPLYIATVQQGIVVSTDLGLLARETGAWREVDEEYIADVLATGLHLGSRTPYRAIRRLGMGQYATWQAGRLTVAGGWRPRITPITGTAREHEELLRSAVTDAVAGSLPTACEDGAVVVELSGGLDTSTVLGVATRRVTVHAVSFVHPGSPGSDESDWIRAALKATPTPWHPIDATEHGIFSAGPDFGIFLPAPSRRILNWASSGAEEDAVSRLGGSIMLTGEGGDAVFLAGAYPWYLADLLRTGRWAPLRRELQKWSTDSDVKRSAGFWWRRAALGGLRRWRSQQTLTLQPTSRLEVMAPWLNRAYIRDRHLRARVDSTTPLRASSVHAQAVLENIVRCAEFARSRQLLVSGSAEARHPLLAPGLVDLALNTPWQVAADPRIDRAVQRYAFAGLVSDTVLRRRSKTIADEAVLTGFARHPRWQTYLCDDPQLVQRGYVDSSAWTAAIHGIGLTGAVAPLYGAIQVEVWLRHLRHAGRPALLM
ncbi:asparagine synthase-related protein [Mycobacterium sp. pW049]|uniref:asparagine synthase-related protein n=1 Tax=[Mycobacterium] bulgaricum TaxID=3238985 RepID=UPI000DB38AEF|nr:MAG: hypothetical protein DI630_33690 [Gordonia sp. (in: high G+C Gram-positive bacteria)]